MRKTTIVTAYANEKIDRIEETRRRLNHRCPEHKAETEQWYMAAYRSITRIVSRFECGLTTMDETMRAIANVDMPSEI